MSTTWPTERLGNLLRRSDETVDPVSDAEYREITVRLWGKGITERGRALGADLVGRRFVAHAGQFIVSRIDARNGATGLVPTSLEGALVTNDFPLFNVNTERLNPSFLGWLSRTAAFVELCKRASEGTTNRVRLKEERFYGLDIPLPPLGEQCRIVTQIVELTAQIDEARALRREAAEEADTIMSGTRAHYYDHATKLNGTRRLQDVCIQITDGTHWTPSYVNEGIPFLSVKDITGGSISFDNCRYISPLEHTELIKRCYPKKGDVLLTKIGTTGFAKVIDTDREFSVFVSLALLKIRSEVLDAYFLEHMLNSNRLRELSAAGTRGVGNQNLVLKFIREFPIPLPPLAEQRRIVTELDALQTEVDKLKRLQTDTAAELDALLPSTLHHAFRGEL